MRRETSRERELLPVLVIKITLKYMLNQIITITRFSKNILYPKNRASNNAATMYVKAPKNMQSSDMSLTVSDMPSARRRGHEVSHR